MSAPHKKDESGVEVRLHAGWGMVERPNGLYRLLFRLFFDARDLGPECRSRIRQSHKKGIPVYVAGHRQFFVFLFFNWVFYVFGFPVALFVNALHVWFLQPVKAFLTYLRKGFKVEEVNRLERAVRSGRPGFLFLKSPMGLVSDKRPMGVRHIKRLIELEQNGELERPLVFVPLMAVWGHHPVRAARSRSALGRIFGQPETPGRLRSLLQFVVFLRRMRVRVGDPLPLQDFLRRHKGLNSAAAAGELRWELLGNVERQRNAILGPPRKGAAKLRAELIGSTRFQRKLDSISLERGKKREDLEVEADKYLKEISADIGPLTLRFMRSFMGIVFSRIFTYLEVPPEMFEKLRTAGAKGPLIFLPSHKSHVDYLFVSWIVAANGVAPPLIAAGVNLSFWPVGPIFRRSGAFFLRRSFGGNTLYTEVFAEYLSKVLREGYNMEFFIEGGRSRTGKVLEPKMGLLKWIAEAAIRDNLDTVQLVPMDISYEKVIEAGSYARELAEGNKKSEGAGDLVKAGGVLGSRFGSVSLHLGEPFPLIDALKEAGLKLNMNPGTSKYEEVEGSALAAAVSRVARRVVFQISRLCTITPTSLLAAGLLCSGRRVVTRKFLLAACGVFAQRARAYGARFNRALEPPEVSSPKEESDEVESNESFRLFSKKAIDFAIEVFARDNLISIHRESEVTLYRISDESRTILSYYRNSLINHLAQEFIMAQGVIISETKLGGPGALIPSRMLRRIALELSKVLKKEFTYESGVPFDVIFSDTLEAMESWALEPVMEKADGALEPVMEKADGALELEESKERPESLCYRVDPKARKQVVLLAGLGEDFIQAYSSATKGLRELLAGPMGRKRLEKRMVERCLREYFMGEVSRREACNRILCRNAIELWLDEGVLKLSAGRSRSGTPIALESEWADEEALEGLARRIPSVDWEKLSQTLQECS